MRLRLETGDFKIVMGENGTTVRTGLNPYQFLGYVVEDGAGEFTVITAVKTTETGAELTAGATTLVYVKETGAITVKSE